VITPPTGNASGGGVAEAVCDIGCVYQDSCVPFGTRFMEGNVPAYCGINKEIVEQKENSGECQNNYECISYNCKENNCKPLCEGCLDTNDNCLSAGTRTKTEYCDADGLLKSQKNTDESCYNNYECSSNLCISNSCVSPTAFQRFLVWLRGIFGRGK
jgi:hypothetical protein